MESMVTLPAVFFKVGPAACFNDLRTTAYAVFREKRSRSADYGSKHRRYEFGILASSKSEGRASRLVPGATSSASQEAH